MESYPVKVSTATSFEQAMQRFPEMKAAVMKGVAFLSPPASAPLINVSKIRAVEPEVSAPARRPGI